MQWLRDNTRIQDPEDVSKISVLLYFVMIYVYVIVLVCCTSK